MDDEILGDFNLANTARSTQIRGRAVHFRLRYLTKHFGEEALRQILDGAGTQAQRLFATPPLPFSWIDLGMVMDFDYQMITQLWGGRIGRMRQLQAEMAKEDLAAPYQVLMKLGNPRFIVSKVDLAFRHYFKPGGVDTVELKKGRGIGRLRGPALPYYTCSEALPGWQRAAVELSGGRNVAVLHRQCRHRGDADCIWDISWQDGISRSK